MASDNERKFVNLLLLGLMFLLALIYITIPPVQQAMGVYLFIGIISLVVYNFTSTKDDVVGISFKDSKKQAGLFKSAFYGIIYAGAFFIVVQFVPGASIGIPNLPQSITNEIRLFVLFFIAPIFETVLQASFLGYLKELNFISKKRALFLVFLSGLFMATLHLSAYIAGFYNYPGFTQGLQAITANIGAFISAFFFFFTSGIFMFLSRYKILNLIFGFVSHSLTNMIITFFLSVTFAIGQIG